MKSLLAFCVVLFLGSCAHDSKYDPGLRYYETEAFADTYLVSCNSINPNDFQKLTNDIFKIQTYSRDLSPNEAKIGNDLDKEMIFLNNNLGKQVVCHDALTVLNKSLNKALYADKFKTK